MLAYPFATFLKQDRQAAVKASKLLILSGNDSVSDPAVDVKVTVHVLENQLINEITTEDELAEIDGTVVTCKY
ncbi:MAG: hypothetical protein SPG61_02885 [Arcanobacterium sp.]|nr:hypothetical protein [Arcanobacterium sp.]